MALASIGQGSMAYLLHTPGLGGMSLDQEHGGDITVLVMVGAASISEVELPLSSLTLRLIVCLSRLSLAAVLLASTPFPGLDSPPLLFISPPLQLLLVPTLVFFRPFNVPRFANSLDHERVTQDHTVT